MLGIIGSWRGMHDIFKSNHGVVSVTSNAHVSWLNLGHGHIRWVSYAHHRAKTIDKSTKRITMWC